MHTDPYVNAALAYWAWTKIPAAPEMMTHLTQNVNFRAAVDATIVWTREWGDLAKIYQADASGSSRESVIEGGEDHE
jgi:hypothetical protein